MTTQSDEGAHVSAARAGDEKAFHAMVSPHRKVLFAHCYRMLGSAADAEDALQETLIRAWKYLATFEARSSVRSWLYSISSKVCLDQLAHRGHRTLSGFDDTPPSNGASPPSDPLPASHWLEPISDDRWAEQELHSRESPESHCTLRQSVALAFLATIQLLPAPQRAALLLHEVAGWNASEIAGALDQSVASVNSSLQRARKTLDERIPHWHKQSSVTTSAQSTPELLRQYVRAWETGDPKLLASVLCENAMMTMPPVSMWFASRKTIVQFFSTFILALPTKFRGSELRMVNGEPAIAIYSLMPDGQYVADSLHVFTLDSEGAIERVSVFRSVEAVTECGLAAVLA